MLALAKEYGKYIRALKGKTKKCLVLDCDNTLWGGIVGEEGLSGIKLGGTYPGSSFQSFQEKILNLKHRGVILALCSKNNEEDVLAVFEKTDTCSDGMSDETYAYDVKVIDEHIRLLSGCCKILE